MSSDSSPVQVYVYDLSGGLARAMSQGILGRQIDGVWHTGIVAFGQEYFFGGTTGIEACAPGGTILGNPTQKVDLGVTEIPFDVFMDYLHELAQTSFRAETYHLFHHNCNNFSSEVAQFLTGKDIPSHITSLPQDVLSTPFGAMIQPFVESMHVQGGHSPFQSSNNPPN
ncbi:desumoylating isopeptidase 1 [Aplysia californica]|uniref:Desumoylating isopeptidase 1 n=1 Tax=Aplysia californica TaxID=6500 RepID=A0ABM0JFE5_APLCA|nr:desumoylating isopeptidase 1 [Aplysia californica]XP_005092452.1 desumoylating isopeptidase 1 [Aplysia californica]XP_005092453.1 desumoylating isopeptidase 1 [Aplysia californica]XP_035824095.1 desumoylating isopeptidase 1 [Aplysia californica]